MGRPLKLSDPNEVQQSIESYLESTDEPILTGLCKHLGVAYDTFQDALQRKDDVSLILKKGLTSIASKIEHRAVWKNAPGAMYWLKAVLGWVETRVVEQHQYNYDQDSGELAYSRRTARAKTEENQALIN